MCLSHAGGNSGVGKETAIALAMRGARVIIACRDVDKAEKAVRDIKIRSHSVNVLHKELDLANMRSIRDFCKSFLQREKRLDILINNAGQSLGKHLVSGHSEGVTPQTLLLTESVKRVWIKRQQDGQLSPTTPNTA